MVETVAPNLSNYRVISQLSTGGMGSVYLAEDLKLHRKVAIKALTPEWAADPDRYQRFRWEAEVLAKLNHPNIVTIYAIEEEEGAHFLIMELVEGRTLDEVIPSVGMSAEQIFKIAIPLAEALTAAHEQGIIHRDLKPGNIMVTQRRPGEGPRLRPRQAATTVRGERTDDARSELPPRTRRVVRCWGRSPTCPPSSSRATPSTAAADIFLPRHHPL